MVWLNNARVLAVFAVILLHVSSEFVANGDIGSKSWWIGNAYNSIVRWCVPVFVMISGALLLAPFKQESLLTFYKKRLSKILIPALFWTSFFLGWRFLKGVVGGNELAITDLAKDVLMGKPSVHMWFLYMLSGLYLFTPFFRKVAKNSTVRDTKMLVAVTFSVAAINSYINSISFGELPGSPANWFLYYIPYFFLGYLIRQDKRTPPTGVLWLIFLSSYLATALGCYIASIRGGWETGLYFYEYLSISVIPMSISIMYIFKAWNKPLVANANMMKTLSFLTFGIYLIHPFVLDIINYINFLSMNIPLAVAIPAIAIIVFSLSLCAVWTISKVPYLKRTI